MPPFYHSKRLPQICVYVYFLFFVIQLFWTLPVFAQSQKLVIPTYFATERVFDNGSTGIDYTDGQISGSLLNFGVKNIDVVDTGYPEMDSERSRGLGWWTKLPSASEADFGKHLRSITLTKSEFFSNIRAIVNDGPTKRPLIVYVNGCCAPFSPGMVHAAKIERSIQAPVLLYSWAAIPPTMQFYRENENRQKQGIERFVLFLEDLEKEIPPEQTILVAHSMGNRFLYEALRLRYYEKHRKDPSSPRYLGAAFAAADVNADEFASEEKAIASTCQHIWITANNTDPALAASSLQRGLYFRLGAPFMVINKLISTANVDVFGIAEEYPKSHELPIPVLSQIILGIEDGYHSKQFMMLQNKPHYFHVRKK
ncbi:MAG: alpha/beta hydrolase [Cyanobacteria bacterium TGS_CYA1]|nr:alpha/beta hydrolase [Cyanobacteria bacterium TGS_CYA1]